MLQKAKMEPMPRSGRFFLNSKVLITASWSRVGVCYCLDRAFCFKSVKDVVLMGKSGCSWFYLMDFLRVSKFWKASDGAEDVRSTPSAIGFEIPYP